MNRDVLIALITCVVVVVFVFAAQSAYKFYVTNKQMQECREEYSFNNCKYSKCMMSILGKVYEYRQVYQTCLLEDIKEGLLCQKNLSVS